MIEPDVTHALASAVGHVNVSMPTAMTVDDLRAALHADPVDPTWSHHLHAILDETAVEILADLVRSGATTHARLHHLAQRTLRPDHTTLRWLAVRACGQPLVASFTPPPCWRTLLTEARDMLSHASAVHGLDAPCPLWVIGGDVAIAHALEHRAPLDLSIALIGLTLRDLTPTRNPAVARLARDFVWDGASLRIGTATGVILFQAGPLQTDPGFTWSTLDGAMFAMATPEEAVVTALRFRSADLRPTDIVDIAALARDSPDLSRILIREVPDALPRALVEVDRIVRLETAGMPADLQTDCARVRSILTLALQAVAVGNGGA